MEFSLQLLLLTLCGFTLNAHVTDAVCSASTTRRYQPKVINGSDTYTCPQPANSQVTLMQIEAETNALLDAIIPSLHQGEFPCGETGWTQVAYLNMDDPTHHCPHAWIKTSDSSHPACGRRASGCQSVNYTTGGIKYTRVCGRIIAYQFGRPEGFAASHIIGASIDTHYIDGISVTKGYPRQHIWTFVAGKDQRSDNPQVCPCSNPPLYRDYIAIPNYIGNNYFCDSGVIQYPESTNAVLHTYNPIWDGEGCEAHTTCCNHNSWFSTTVPSATCDDIEVRICANNVPQDEDTPIKLMEIYVK